jgi:hypothetical protein
MPRKQKFVLSLHSEHRELLANQWLLTTTPIAFTPLVTDQHLEMIRTPSSNAAREPSIVIPT